MIQEQIRIPQFEKTSARAVVMVLLRCMTSVRFGRGPDFV
jgi:hypothetical protein